MVWFTNTLSECATDLSTLDSSETTHIPWGKQALIKRDVHNGLKETCEEGGRKQHGLYKTLNQRRLYRYTTRVISHWNQLQYSRSVDRHSCVTTVTLIHLFVLIKRGYSRPGLIKLLIPGLIKSSLLKQEGEKVYSGVFLLTARFYIYSPFTLTL